MTLILSSIRRDSAVQVSDRLLTYRGGTVFDPASNKTIVLRASDAIVTMSYTGVAYIGPEPTDSWLASTLAGIPLTGPRFMIRTGGRGALPLGLNLKRLQRRLDDHLSHRPDYFEILGCGLYQPRSDRPPRSIMFLLSKPTRARFSLQVTRLPWPLPIYAGAPATFGRWIVGQLTPNVKRTRCYRLSASSPDNNILPSEIEALTNRLGLEVDPTAQAEIMVETLRTIASRRVGIGEDCMSVAMLGPHVYVRYWPKVWPFEEFLRGTERIRRPVVYTPWVIGPGLMRAPALVTGSGGSITFGDVTVEFVAPPADGFEGIATAHSQPRPPRP